ncbi:uncharacterized protein I206_102172 [Kwoniella pini CBS 10737]|uniref:BZIP domain-containing protein n=1 Tax=Kwoniella pini CBS 10737 TaxID=1296096 RepID=A0A1B9HUL4_9TREE|nr:uncharacterized protein I206_06733 [Kwoniella pini CBS 10737]OCF46959.1 hypothetical protein I206_06733 [Kwoniella pini CBS 10737]
MSHPHNLPPIGQAPQQQIHSLNNTRRASSTSTRQHHHNHNDYSDSESDGEDDKVEKDKLEIRREKNRVKQRNLRLRRANHIAELEKNLANFRADQSILQNNITHLQARENSLQGWIHDLESALFRNGLAGEVETLRRIWSDKNTSIPQTQHQIRPKSQHGFSQQPPLPTPAANAPLVDPLSTLARAASSIPPGVPSSGRMSYPSSSATGSRPTLPQPISSSRPFENPYPTPELHWGSQMSEWVPAPSEMEKKRKRDSQSEYTQARPVLHPMSGRLSESNVHTLPPIQSYRSGSPSSARPTSAPYQSKTSAPISASTSGTGNISPRSIRISDLVSPRPFDVESGLPSLSRELSGSDHSYRQSDMLTAKENGWNRISRGASSPDKDTNGLSQSRPNKLAPIRFFQSKEDRVYPISTPSSPKTLSPNHSLIKMEREEVSPKTRNSLSPTALRAGMNRSPLLQVKENPLLDGQIPKSA